MILDTRLNPALVLGVVLLASACCIHSPSAGGLSFVKDVDGNTYPAVSVGNQVWLGANLRATRTSAGAPLTTHAPNNDPSTVPTFGRLYAWSAAIVACPSGWRLPSDEDWSQLEDALGSEAGLLIRDPSFWPPSDPERAPTPLPAAGAVGRLAVRPAGYQNDEGFENFFGSRAVFWTATRQDEHLVWSRVVAAGAPSLRRAPQHPQYGFSVRCVRGTPSSSRSSSSATPSSPPNPASSGRRFARR